MQDIDDPLTQDKTKKAYGWRTSKTRSASLTGGQTPHWRVLPSPGNMVGEIKSRGEGRRDVCGLFGFLHSHYMSNIKSRWCCSVCVQTVHAISWSVYIRASWWNHRLSNSIRPVAPSIICNSSSTVNSVTVSRNLRCCFVFSLRCPSAFPALRGLSVSFVVWRTIYVQRWSISGRQTWRCYEQSREWVDGSWVKWVTKIGWVMGH